MQPNHASTMSLLRSERHTVGIPFQKTCHSVGLNMGELRFPAPRYLCRMTHLHLQVQINMYSSPPCH